MKSTFAQLRDIVSVKRRFAALRKALIKKCRTRNVFENWKINSATAAIGCEFEI